MTNADEPATILREVIAALQRAEIRHMIVGSFASTFHGEPRTTRDLDVVIDPSSEQLDALLGALDPQRYYFDVDAAHEALARRTMFNVIEMSSAWKLDLIVRKPRDFSLDELARSMPVTLFGVATRIATAEDTIIAKLEWAKAGGSLRQLEDVAGIVRVRGDSLDREHIARWVRELEVEAEWQRVLADVS